jgi:dUTP pyrophosphatase
MSVRGAAILRNILNTDVEKVAGPRKPTDREFFNGLILLLAICYLLPHMLPPVDIFKNHPDAILPVYASPGACAFDLSPIEDATIAPGEIVRMRTGLIIRAPEGYTLLIAARSSLPRKYGLCVPQGFGIVDNDFCGPEDELLIQLLNFTKEPTSVKKGDRIVQGMFVPFVRGEFRVIDQLDKPSRGGFGSTG